MAPRPLINSQKNFNNKNYNNNKHTQKKTPPPCEGWDPQGLITH